MLPLLPKTLERLTVPPLKIQGIKTRLVRFILGSIRWEGRGRWVEPFLGSGVVVFNLLPRRALLGDRNPHIVRFYADLQKGVFEEGDVRGHLEHEGALLARRGADHYYAVRERFNASHDPLDFLFLNRSCFNGMMRFNRSGGFNVPFCRKPERFSKAYVSKIVNQVGALRRAMEGRDWEFRSCDWSETVSDLMAEDFLYMDPPYFGRHADYFNQWDEEDAARLADRARAVPCAVALSMWKSNRFRVNEHLEAVWGFLEERTTEHFYHLGSSLELRHSMVEALRLSPHVAVASREG